MTTVSENIHEIAASFVGTQEYPGARHNSVVLGMYAASGHPEITTDEVPWCAAFVGAVLAQAGLPNTGSLLARSYSHYGEAVENWRSAVAGDVVVFRRGEPWQGHVAIVTGRFGNGTIEVIGGNQSNSVSVNSYNTQDIVAVRRPVVPRSSLAQSNTIAAASIVGVITPVTATVAATADLAPSAQITLIILAAVTLLAAALIFKDRIKSWFGRGNR